MHVCITGPKTCPPEIGGVEVFGWEIAKRVAAKGIKVTVVSGRLRGQAPAETLQRVEIRRVWSLRNRFLLKLSNMPGVNRVLNRLNPEVIHANDATSAFVATSAPRRKHAVVTIHGIGYAESDWPPPFRQGIRIFQQTAVKRAAAVVATDDVTASALQSIRQDVSVIPPGVDTEVFRRGFHPWPEKLTQGKFNVLFVGRLSRVKGFDLLVDALTHLEPSVRSELVLTVIGNGPLAQLVGKAVRVNWLGELPHESLPPYFANAGLLVLPSRSEGLPISLLEAMSSELPVACSLAGGIRSHFGEDEVTVIDPLTAEGVADAINKVLSDPGAARRKAALASIRVRKEFSWDSVAQKYIDVYERLAD
jgi:glycosyltransferase involved in cell wall biosynthesis